MVENDTLDSTVRCLILKQNEHPSWWINGHHVVDLSRFSEV